MIRVCALVLAILFAIIPDVHAIPTPVLGIGHVGLTWVNPTTNSDGTSIYDLAGTYIYYHPIGVVRDINKRVRVLGAGRTVVLFVNMPGLTDADLEFEATSFDTSDNQSIPSNKVIRSLGTNAGEIPGSSTVTNQ